MFLLKGYKGCLRKELQGVFVFYGVKNSPALRMEQDCKIMYNQ